MGSKLSGRRSTSGRPKICKTPPPLPPIADTIVCDLLPHEFTIELGMGQDLDTSACHSGLPMGDPITTSYWASGGEFTESLPPTNCIDGTAQYVNFDNPGDYSLKITYQWSDGRTCSAWSTAHVIF